MFSSDFFFVTSKEDDFVHEFTEFLIRTLNQQTTFREEAGFKQFLFFLVTKEINTNFMISILELPTTLSI